MSAATIVLAGQNGGAHVELAVRGVGLLVYLDGPAADVGHDRVLHVIHIHDSMLSRDQREA